jgi:hypothetical protein
MTVAFDLFADQGFWFNLVKQLLAAGVVAGLTFLIARAKGFRRGRTFRRIFGKGIRNSEDIILSVPLWRAIPGNRSEKRFIKAGHPAPRLHYGPDEMYNRQDMFAAAHVLNVLNTHLDKEVKYSNDYEKADWDQKTVVLIGAPSGNEHTRYYLDEHKQRRPKEVFPCFLEHNETDDTRAGARIHDPKSGKEYRSDEKYDFGLVLRLPNVFSKGSNHFVFVIAGIHEWSTREAGRLFNARWSTLGQEPWWRRLLRLLQPWTWHEPSPAAGFIFRMNYGEHGIGTGGSLDDN